MKAWRCKFLLTLDTAILLFIWRIIRYGAVCLAVLEIRYAIWPRFVKRESRGGKKELRGSQMDSCLNGVVTRWMAVIKGSFEGLRETHLAAKGVILVGEKVRVEIQVRWGVSHLEFWDVYHIMLWMFGNILRDFHLRAFLILSLSTYLYIYSFWVYKTSLRNGILKCRC